MRLHKKYIFFSLILFFVTDSFGQDATNGGGSGFMYDNGKIFVVMAVVIVIMLGLFAYLFNLDRKITRLEKKEKS